MSSSAKVALQEPLKVDGKQVTEIALREPRGSDLRGVQMVALFQGSVGVLAKLAPRISTPPITADQVEMMPLSDVQALWTGVLGFMKASEAADETGLG